MDLKALHQEGEGQRILVILWFISPVTTRSQGLARQKLEGWSFLLASLVVVQLPSTGTIAFCLFQAISQSCTGSGAAGTWTSSHVGLWSHKWKFYPLRHNARCNVYSEKLLFKSININHRCSTLLSIIYEKYQSPKTKCSALAAGKILVAIVKYSQQKRYPHC